jgi:hypothetical protein
MNRQELVIKALTDGFGPERVTVHKLADGKVLLVVKDIEATFEIDGAGNVMFPLNISNELAYWIVCRLRSLDILIKKAEQ